MEKDSFFRKLHSWWERHRGGSAIDKDLGKQAISSTQVSEEPMAQPAAEPEACS